MNRHEKLGEYIIKNLLFSFILIVIVAFIFLNILMPKIKILKEKQSDYRRVESIYQGVVDTNQGILDQIKKKKEESVLSFLEKDISETYIQSIAKDFFQEVNVKKTARELLPDSQFASLTYTLTAKATGTKDVFDFAKKLQQLVPAATLTLPFKIKKTDLLKNILDIELTIKIIQSKAFFEKQNSTTNTNNILNANPANPPQTKK